jgi:hypothetical protein
LQEFTTISFCAAEQTCDAALCELCNICFSRDHIPDLSTLHEALHLLVHPVKIKLISEANGPDVMVQRNLVPETLPLNFDRSRARLLPNSKLCLNVFSLENTMQLIMNVVSSISAVNDVT